MKSDMEQYFTPYTFEYIILTVVLCGVRIVNYTLLYCKSHDHILYKIKYNIFRHVVLIYNEKHEVSSRVKNKIF